jgi:hypothetical protein
MRVFERVERCADARWHELHIDFLSAFSQTYYALKITFLTDRFIILKMLTVQGRVFYKEIISRRNRSTCILRFFPRTNVRTKAKLQ